MKKVLFLSKIGIRLYKFDSIGAIDCKFIIFLILSDSSTSLPLFHFSLTPFQADSTLKNEMSARIFIFLLFV